VYDWAVIATQFVAEYMDLRIVPGAGANVHEKHDIHEAFPNEIPKRLF
jgi:hypothetical protein